MPNLTQKPLRALAILWLLAIIMAWPVGDFPLDDDWSYAEAVKHWVDTGEYWVSDWPAMTLFTQVIWGGLFAKVFGFSFYALRLSTLVLTVLGILAFRKTMARLELPGWWQLAALLTLVFNPVFFELSLTFMTDIPFLSLMAMSLYAYLRAFEQDHWRWWAAATLFSSLAILLRQPALLLPLSMGIAGFLGRPGWQRLGLAFLSTAIVYLCLQGYILWQQSTPSGLPGAFSQPGSIRHMLTPGHLMYSIQSLGGLYLVYIGFMLLPVLLLCLVRPRTKAGWALAMLTTAISLYLISLIWGSEPLGNTVHTGGLGTIPLPGERQDTHWPVLPPILGWAAKGLGTVGLVLLIGHTFLRVVPVAKMYIKQLSLPRLSAAQTLRLGLAGFLLPYGLFLLANFVHFDRYLLPVLLSSLLVLQPAPNPAKWAVNTSWALILLMACFSIAGTHDYFAWNRARWAALHSAMSQGIPPTEIDGGVEFNGWYRTGPLRQRAPFSNSWWFVAEDTYAVSFGPFENYRIEEEFVFQRYLPPGTDTLFLLRRPAWTKIDTLFYPMEPRQWPDYAPYANLRASEQNKAIPGSYDDTHVYIMDTNQEYGLAHRLFPVSPYEELQFSVWAKAEEGLPGIVVSAPDADAFHHALQLYPTGQTRGDWSQYQTNMNLPEYFPADTVATYFWKRSPNRILLDDFQIIWKQTNSR